MENEIVKANCSCVICGKNTLTLTGKTIVSWDGEDKRAFVKCLNERCNCEYTLAEPL